MPRLEQNKSSQEGDLESEEDFFEGNEDAKSQESKSSCSTPRFSQDDQEFTIVKLNWEEVSLHNYSKFKGFIRFFRRNLINWIFRKLKKTKNGKKILS